MVGAATRFYCSKHHDCRYCFYSCVSFYYFYTYVFTAAAAAAAADGAPDSANW